MKYSKKSGVSIVTVILGIFIILVAAGLVIDTGMVLNAQSELQKQTETTALYGATFLEPGSNLTINETAVTNTVTEIFNISKSLNFSSTLDVIELNSKSKALRISSHANVPVFFLSIIGIFTVEIKAQATALSSPFYLSSEFPQKPTKGSLLTFSLAESEVRRPLSHNTNLSTDGSGNFEPEYIYNAADGKAISLGAGGYLMIRLPVPLTDEAGADLYIKELGNLEGYFVFAGTDVDPENPYISEADQGAGIKWVNISCTGTPEGVNLSKVGAYYVDIEYPTSQKEYDQAKFYGSGYFDIGATCTKTGLTTYNHNLRAAKYLKIIDDNEEDGFLANNSDVPVILQGEHSSATPGADVDSIAVLHHSRLIRSAEYDNNTNDSDGLIDILENIIGTDPAISDTDGDGIDDGLEYSGWYDTDSSVGPPYVPASIINASPLPSHIYLTSPLVDDVTYNKSILYY